MSLCGIVYSVYCYVHVSLLPWVMLTRIVISCLFCRVLLVPQIKGSVGYPISALLHLTPLQPFTHTWQNTTPIMESAEAGTYGSGVEEHVQEHTALIHHLGTAMYRVCHTRVGILTKIENYKPLYNQGVTDCSISLPSLCRWDFQGPARAECSGVYTTCRLVYVLLCVLLPYFATWQLKVLTYIWLIFCFSLTQLFFIKLYHSGHFICTWFVRTSNSRS